MNVIDYVREEVRRQGHDVTRMDGIQRVGWMLEAWAYALGRCHRRPEMHDGRKIGQLVEQVKNQYGYRDCEVYLRGVNKRFAPAARIEPLLAVLWPQREVLSPLEFYRGFEDIHPFLDGNGRTGKVLLNWLNGTLLDPVFPPADFWGDVIVNP